MKRLREKSHKNRQRARRKILMEKRLGCGGRQSQDAKTPYLHILLKMNFCSMLYGYLGKTQRSLSLTSTDLKHQSHQDAATNRHFSLKNKRKVFER